MAEFVTLTRKAASEVTGTALLLSTVIGSGIMGERLSGGNVAIALLANTLATGAALIAIISCIRAGLRRTSESGCDSRGCVAWWDGMAGRSGLSGCTGSRRCGRGRGSGHYVWIAGLLDIDTHPKRSRTSVQRIRRHFRAVGGDLGVCTVATEGSALRGRCIHHRCVLVHSVHIVCESCGDVGARVDEHICRRAADRRA